MQGGLNCVSVTVCKNEINTSTRCTVLNGKYAAMKNLFNPGYDNLLGTMCSISSHISAIILYIHCCSPFKIEINNYVSQLTKEPQHQVFSILIAFTWKYIK